MDSDLHIVLVDDDRLLVKIIAQVLTMRGMKVAISHDGEEGLRLIREIAPDLIILDIMMPKLDGFTVCRRLKADPDTRDIPVLVFSALGPSELQTIYKDAATLGADAYLTKPVQISKLLEQVSALLATPVAGEAVVGAPYPVRRVSLN
jgi:two-component system response regulator RpaA